MTQASVKVTWNESAFMRDLMTATKGALDAGALVGVVATQQNLSRAGTPTSASGWVSYRKADMFIRHLGGIDAIRRGKDKLAAFTAARMTKSGRPSAMAAGLSRAIDIEIRGGGKLVDPPGGMPRNRTGTLMRSISWDVKSPTSRRIGVGQGAEKYAAIQEFGGTVMNHGGQPFFKTWDGQLVFVSKKSPHAARMAKTKPHAIRIPARPYLRRSVTEAQGEIGKAMQGAFSAILREKGWVA